jgi:hypothetical protein
MDFEWNPQKAATNMQKHRVSFSEAATVFDDPLSQTVPDPDHSVDEDRLLIVGASHQGRLLIVSFAERGDRLRIISARELTRIERQAYEEGRYD